YLIFVFVPVGIFTLLLAFAVFIIAVEAIQFILIVHTVLCIVFLHIVVFFHCIGNRKIGCSHCFRNLSHGLEQRRVLLTILLFQDLNQFDLQIIGTLKIIDVIELLMRIVDKLAQTDIFHEQYFSIPFALNRLIRNFGS